MPLWQTIVSSREDLLEAFLAANSGRAPGPVAAEAEDAIARLLDQLVVSLRAADLGGRATLLPEAKLMAGSFGQEGAETGRDIDEVVSDLLQLHDAILDVCQRRGEEITPAEYRALFRGMTRAISAAVSQYADARDREVQRAHAEHFAFLAHELRTPLSNIRMGVDLIQQGLDSSKLVPRIHRALRTVGDLLDNEITRAQIQSGSCRRLEPVPLTKLLEGVVEGLGEQARESDISVELQTDGGLVLNADVRLLRSVFTNLVGNAVKFSRSHGEVLVEAREEGNAIVCQIHDCCGGVSDHDREAMLQPFEPDRERRGPGLGLAIAVEAVGLHEGSIDVKNRPGEGCSVEVRLPTDLAGQEGRGA